MSIPTESIEKGLASMRIERPLSEHRDFYTHIVNLSSLPRGGRPLLTEDQARRILSLIQEKNPLPASSVETMDKPEGIPFHFTFNAGNTYITFSEKLGSGKTKKAFLGMRIAYMERGESPTCDKVQACAMILIRDFRARQDEIKLNEKRRKEGLWHPHVQELPFERIRFSDGLLFPSPLYKGDMRTLFTSSFYLDKLISYATQLLQGVGYLHQRGMIHRDIKPHNIFLDLKGNIRIGDLSFMTKQDSPVSSYCGTIFYLPPEFFSIGYSEEEKKEMMAHPARDMWAVGLVLFQWYFTLKKNPLSWYAKSMHIFLGSAEDLSEELPHLYRAMHKYLTTHLTKCEKKPLTDPKRIAALQVIVGCLAWDPRERPTAERCLSLLGASPIEGGKAPEEATPRTLDDAEAITPPAFEDAS